MKWRQAATARATLRSVGIGCVDYARTAESRYGAGTVIDISPSGYRILSTTELAIGAEVLITLNSVAIVGHVRHCEPAELNSFTAGVEITQVISGTAKLSGRNAA